VLRTHANATAYLDVDAAALLSPGLADHG
jgi:hypothetical protein